MQKFVKMLLPMLMSFSATLAAAPVGYSINADSPTDNADSLYRIDLATGAETRIAPVRALGLTRIDVEGLAFAADGTLYAADDDTLTFFPLNPDNALVDVANETTIKGLPPTPVLGGNDFGMTFACDGNLYITSVAEGNLYRMDLDGDTHLIGSLGGVNISALAAYGNPARLYGLGNGLDGSLQTDAPNLYEIDLGNGLANLIGPLQNAAPYSESGLSFDDAGQLWAITDRRNLDQPSQIMKIKGCVACHSLDGSKLVGPTFKNVYGYEFRTTEGTTVLADAAYIKASILEPNASIIEGYQPVMPAYAGILDERELEAIVAFLKTISDRGDAGGQEEM